MRYVGDDPKRDGKVGRRDEVRYRVCDCMLHDYHITWTRLNLMRMACWWLQNMTKKCWQTWKNSIWTFEISKKVVLSVWLWDDSQTNSHILKRHLTLEWIFRYVERYLNLKFTYGAKYCFIKHLGLILAEYEQSAKKYRRLKVMKGKFRFYKLFGLHE